MKFSLLPILLIIVIFGAVYSEFCMTPTIVRGQVFVDGNLLPNGTIEICVENPQSCNNISISDGTYSYAPTINDSGSNITLKIYDENNKFLYEKTFFIGCGENSENNIYVNTSNQISSSSATTNKTSETNNNVNTINQNNPPQTQSPTSNTQQNSNPLPLHSMPNSPPSTASDTSLNTSNNTSISGPLDNFSATNNVSINGTINNTNRSQETINETINISEYNVSNTSNNSASSINFDSTTMYLLIVVAFLFIILIFLWKRSNKTT